MSDTLRQRAEQLFVTCKRCEGEGRLWADGKAHYAFEPVATIDCPLCGGTGQMGPDIDAIHAALQEVVEEERERCATLAVQSIERMILLYDGKLPYFVYQHPRQDNITNDASIAGYTAHQIAAAIRQQGAR